MLVLPNSPTWLHLKKFEPRDNEVMDINYVVITFILKLPCFKKS